MTDYNKLYPNLDPSAPEYEGEIYRLRKIDELSKFLQDEMTERRKITKRFKRKANLTGGVGYFFAGVSVVGGLLSAGLSGTGIGIVLAIPIGIISAGAAFGATFTYKTHKIFTTKVKKHDKITLLAEAKLDSISGIHSKALQDGHISAEEYSFILKEIQNYRTMKQQIREKSQHVTETITTEQREAILQQGRKEGKNAFLAQIAGSSDTPPVAAM